MDKLGAGEVRTRRLKLALLTSLAGKGISTVVQLAALPLAINALGQERFGAYAMLAACLNWMSIVSITIAPGLTVEIVAANAIMDRNREARAFGSAFTFSLLFAVLLFAGTQLLVHSISLEKLFGAAYIHFASELESGITALSILLAMNVVLGVAEATQAGYQKQYVHNIFLAGGNMLTIFAIALLVRAKPTVANMIVAVYAGPLIARGMSLAQLLWSRPYLARGILAVDLTAVTFMARTGAAFLLTSVASFCYQSFSVYWAGRRIGPLAATQMSVFITILGALGSILMMFTQPLWPAIQDATMRGDTYWVNRTYLRLGKYLMTYVGVAACIVAVAGQHITHLWVRSAVAISGTSQILLGAYFLLVAWEQYNYIFIIGMGRFWFAALSYFTGALLMLTNSTWLVARFGVSGMLAAMCSGPLLVTSWAYPWQLNRLLVGRDSLRAATDISA
jgi:O-antigen/teichoic acid export membrane protein